MTQPVAHVLVAIENEILSRVIEACLESEGHGITVAHTFDEALGVLRSSLHPLVVVLEDFYPWRWPEEDVTALAANVDALCAHMYIMLRYRFEPFPPAWQSILDRLLPYVLSMPFDLQEVVDSVNAAAAHVAAD